MKGKVSIDSQRTSHLSSPGDVTPGDLVRHKKEVLAKQNDKAKLRKGPVLRDSRLQNRQPLGVGADENVLQNRQLVGHPQALRYCQCAGGGTIEDGGSDLPEDSILTDEVEK